MGDTSGVAVVPTPEPELSLWRRLRARYTDRQIAGAASTLAGLLITIGLALWGSSGSPPKLFGALALTVLAAAFQTGAAWLFSHGQGTAQSDHAESSVGSLLRLWGQVRTLKQMVEAIVRKKSATETDLRVGLGSVSVSLEYIEERVGEAVGHWNQFYPEAVHNARHTLEEQRNG